MIKSERFIVSGSQKSDSKTFSVSVTNFFISE